MMSVTEEMVTDKDGVSRECSACLLCLEFQNFWFEMRAVSGTSGHVPKLYFVVLQSHFQKCFLLPVAVWKIH